MKPIYLVIVAAAAGLFLLLKRSETKTARGGYGAMNAASSMADEVATSQSTLTNTDEQIFSRRGNSWGEPTVSGFASVTSAPIMEATEKAFETTAKPPAAASESIPFAPALPKPVMTVAKPVWDTAVKPVVSTVTAPLSAAAPFVKPLAIKPITTTANITTATVKNTISAAKPLVSTIKPVITLNPIKAVQATAIKPAVASFNVAKTVAIKPAIATTTAAISATKTAATAVASTTKSAVTAAVGGVKSTFSKLKVW